MHWTSKAYHDCGNGAEMFRLRERKMELGLRVVVFVVVGGLDGGLVYTSEL